MLDSDAIFIIVPFPLNVDWRIQDLFEIQTKTVLIGT